MRSSRIWDSVISVPLQESFDQSKTRCIRGLGVRTPCRSFRYAASSRAGSGARRLTAAPNLDSRSQENRPNQTAASGRALRAPRCGGRSLFGPLLEEPGREGPDGIIVRDGAFPSA